jgi:hypothetical protein
MEVADMKANFDTDPLKIRSDGRWLEACGPLDWADVNEPTPADKVIVAVRIVQNDVEAQGISHVCDTSQPEWMIYLRPAPGQKFQPGPAHGTAMLTVTDPLSRPDPKTVGWQQDVTLVNA